MASDAARPFGSPDGSRADLDEFVGFEAQHRFGGLATSGNDFTARVFVGRKGAGKTIYLRRQQAAAVSDNSLHADEVQSDFPPTDDVVAFTAAHENEGQVEAWALVWRRAIIQALHSHVLRHPVLRAGLESQQLEALESDFESLFRPHRTPVTIYSQVVEILHYGSPRSRRFTAHLNDPLWVELEYLLSQALHSLPPICFFLDALDEDYHRAPGPWLKCQEGLFLQVMRFLGNAHLGGRLHISVGVRDIVYSAILRSEHGTRYRNAPPIRILEWDERSIRHLFDEKVSRLPDTLLLRPDANDPIERWLGTTSVENPVFGVTESASQYLLRHTRFIPRDIVQLANDLAETVAEARLQQRDCVSGDMIRKTVHRAARALGDEQLVICANQVVAGLVPTAAKRRGEAREYLANTDYRRGIDGTIRDLIRALLTDRFDATVLDEFADAGRADLGAEIDLASILWQNGLLGYAEKDMEEGEVIFHSAARGERFLVPHRKPRYYLHPCMVDAIDGLRVVGAAPVRPANQAA